MCADLNHHASLKASLGDFVEHCAFAVAERNTTLTHVWLRHTQRERTCSMAIHCCDHIAGDKHWGRWHLTAPSRGQTPLLSRRPGDTLPARLGHMDAAPVADTCADRADGFGIPRWRSIGVSRESRSLSPCSGVSRGLVEMRDQAG
jgi:hypothetical protein